MRYSTLLITISAILHLAVLAPPADAAWENVDHAVVYEPLGNATDVDVCTDGQGGMIVAMVDQGASPQKIALSRIDHTGNEVWGNGGVYLPYNMLTDWQDGPMDVTPDGNNGVYCAYRENWSGQHVVTVAHVLANGGVDWIVPVADFQYMGGSPAFELMAQATDNGEVIVVWSRDDYNSLEAERLGAVRVNASGGVLWEVEVNQEIELFQDPAPSFWDVAPDGAGGILVSWSVQPSGQPLEHRAQRVAANGVVMWGGNGHMIWSGYGGLPRIVQDGAGGAYVVVSDGFGEARGQHLDHLGNETWIASGVVVQNAATWPNPCTPAICEDGLGGFFLTQGVENQFAQHVDIWGNLLWGANGMVITSLAGWQDDPAIVNDGAGGCIITYRDHYYSDPGDLHNQVLSGVRVDLFGTVLWSEQVVWWSGWQNGLEPWFPQLVADGSGGALVAWLEFNYSFTANDVYATNVGPDGTAPASPSLAYLSPEASEPGSVVPVLILGDYLEASLTFDLVHESGTPTLSITGISAPSHVLVSGTLDLSAAPDGAYDLVVRRYGTVMNTLTGAFGVGEPPACQGDDYLPAGGSTPILADSPRTAAYDSDGNLHVIWMEWPAGGPHQLYYAKGGPTGWLTAPAVLATGTLSEPCLAIGPDDARHIAYIEEAPGGHGRLAYRRYEPGGGVIVDDLDNGQPKSFPTMVVDIAGDAHLVYQEGASGNTALFHTVHDGLDFSQPEDLVAGTNAREPDLTHDGVIGMTLIFVRNSWFPGLSEVCYQRYNGGTWDQPFLISFGVLVYSPSVAWDGGDQLLFAWILDNTGSAPLLHISLMDAGDLGPVRWHLTDQPIARCAVGGAGAELFYLLVNEANSEITLRSGDGNVFFPKRTMNTVGNVHRPAFAVERDGDGLFAVWENWDLAGSPLIFWDCYDEGTGMAGQAAPVIGNGLTAAPNPFNPSTVLTLSLAEPGWTRLSIYDVHGRMVRTLVDGKRPAGIHEVIWDGRNGDGVALPSGVYFSRLTAPGGRVVQMSKLTLLK